MQVDEVVWRTEISAAMACVVAGRLMRKERSDRYRGGVADEASIVNYFLKLGFPRLETIARGKSAENARTF